MGRASDLSEFDRGMIVGARRAGNSVSETAKLLNFSRTTVSRVYREWSDEQKTSSQRKGCGRKSLVDEEGRNRIKKIMDGNKQITTTQIMAEYNNEAKTGISLRTTRRVLKQMGLGNRRPQRGPILSATKKMLAKVAKAQTVPENGLDKPSFVEQFLVPVMVVHDRSLDIGRDNFH